ncbi:hypothetical protein SM124_13215 [Bacillus sp. 31A1R]|uniref:Uncharacterized protein n=1 Tax=Robertmurraya mangrovi TaxID=3098077 RepID=A0ABU5IZY1_9BACI|nr:hypothetical protein [Bacillus sp. 31A1R]MDZ5472692.1 hypothetical protein [Bacillus sp. 31A1R]
MGLQRANCKPVLFGENVFPNGLSQSFDLACGEERVFYEAISSSLPTLSINVGQQISQGTVACQAVLVAEQGDGTMIEINLPNVERDGAGQISLTIPDVRRIIIRCEEVEGGTGCRGGMTYALSYCECADGCCSCRLGKPVVIGQEFSPVSFYRISCGEETGPLYRSFLEYPPTVTVLTGVNRSICDHILIVEQVDGTIIERNVSWKVGIAV